MKSSTQAPTRHPVSRKRDEQILIGDDIVITVVDIRGDKVRLGIEAPAEVPVHRQEVYAALHRAPECAPADDAAENA